ncbi:MAG: signal peptide peptidase SppA [Pseudomonadota bacterium]
MMKWVGRIFKGLWRALLVLQGLLGILFMVLALIFVSRLVRVEPPPSVPDGAALVLNLNGVIVERKSFELPLTNLVSPRNRPREYELPRLIQQLEFARTDDRIRAMVLQLNEFVGAGAATLDMVADAIARFRDSGKTVIAMGDGYSQAQYRLAVEADEIWMNDQGLVFLTGYGSFRNYYQELIEKLSINLHVFRVGTFKSAVEPYIQNEMSPAAREANEVLLGDLWSGYTRHIETRRAKAGISDLTNLLNTYPEQLATYDGSFARMAQGVGLVDEIGSRMEMTARVGLIVGEEKSKLGFKAITIDDYLKAAIPAQPESDDLVAVVHVAGEIVDGNAIQGVAAGDTVAQLIKRARTSENVKAIVLRVDSPGGSAFASELIRAELALAQAQGKPVLTSMGDVAASGGYWVSATSDEIWAQPNTITGSIGIFAVIPSFEKSFDEIGINNDGVGTTKLSGSLTLGRPLGPELSQMITLSINQGYREFLNLVALGREMDFDRVDEIGQGRVWSGQRALELGLVDKIGTLFDTINAAAKAADLETYRWTILRPQVSQQQLLAQAIDDLITTSVAKTLNSNLPALGGHTFGSVPGSQAATTLFRSVAHDAALALEFKDPGSRYTICLACVGLDQ